jgi:hypothetical protein
MRKAQTSIIVVLIGAAIVLSGCGLFGGPARTTKNFYFAVEAGKLDEAIKLVSNKAKSGMGDEKMRAMLGEATRNIKQRGGISSIEITSEEITGEIADVIGTIKYKDGTTEKINQKLVKEDGDWKLG